MYKIYVLHCVNGRIVENDPPLRNSPLDHPAAPRSRPDIDPQPAGEIRSSVSSAPNWLERVFEFINPYRRGIHWQL